MTQQMLLENPRPDDAEVEPMGHLPVAWKTGTSWGFRDAWSAGNFGPYALIVWVGNFDGSSNPAFVGVQAAAPLFFRIVDALHVAEPQSARAVPASSAAHRTRGSLCGVRRSAQRRLSAHGTHVVRSGQVTHPREHDPSALVDRHSHRIAGLPALRCGVREGRSVRVLAERPDEPLRASGNAAAETAGCRRMQSRDTRRRTASHSLSAQQRHLHSSRADLRARDHSTCSACRCRSAHASLVRRQRVCRRERARGHDVVGARAYRRIHGACSG